MKVTALQQDRCDDVKYVRNHGERQQDQAKIYQEKTNNIKIIKSGIGINTLMKNKQNNIINSSANAYKFHNQSLMHLPFSYFIIFLHLLLIPIKCYNPRVQCRYNNLIFNQRYSTINTFVYRDPSLQKYIAPLNNDQTCGYSYGYSYLNVTNLTNNGDGYLSLDKCRNFIVNNMSCCEAQGFKNFANTINSIYNIWLSNVQYPIMYYMNNFGQLLESNECGYNKQYHPKYNTTVQALMNNYTAIINNIINDDRKFINQTLCLMCIGTMDFSTFIRPWRLDLFQAPITGFIFQRNYFMNRTNTLTNLMLQLQNLHTTMANYILQLANSISSSGTCNLLKLQAITNNFLNGKRICIDQITCKKIVVKYFGQLATPQLAIYISRTGQGLAMFAGAGDYYISDYNNIGFKGNVSYVSLNGNRYLINTTVFKYKDQFYGLY